MSAHLPRHAALLSLVLAAGLLWPARTAAPSVPHTGPSPTNTCLIYSLYRDILGRQADTAGLASGLIYLGTHTHSEYAMTLLTLDEYRSLLIRDWYQRFLGRPASAGDIDSWLSVLGGGAKDEVVMAIILGSNEYFIQARVGSDKTNFIKAIYTDLLHRPVDPAGLAAWTAFLMSNSRQAMAQSILAANEYRTDIVQAWYQKFLGRPADPSGLTSALAILGTVSGTDEQVIATVVGSGEYFNRAGLCASYLPLVRR